jgi:8-oxo-dGTP pyrophosphatase MutT (NUDIX family)
LIFKDKKDKNMDILKFKIFHEVSAGGVVIKKIKGVFKVLVIHRNQMNDWTLPKGHQKKNESLQETAIREVKEETSIKAFPVKYIGCTTYKFIDEKKKVFYFRTVHWFLMECKNDKITKRKNREILEAIWKSFDNQIYHLLTYQNDRNLLKKAQKLLKKLINPLLPNYGVGQENKKGR